jgi:hypothetical protein
MDPAYLPPFVPLLPSAARALTGPFLVAAAVLVTGLSAVVTMLLPGVPRRRRRDTVVVDLIARSRAPETERAERRVRS